MITQLITGDKYITGLTALTLNGLSEHFLDVLEYVTKYKNLDKTRIWMEEFIYIEGYDYINDLWYNEEFNSFIPSKVRSIFDAITIGVGPTEVLYAVNMYLEVDGTVDDLYKYGIPRGHTKDYIDELVEESYIQDSELNDYH